MIIKDIKITNFKSLYGENYFNFMDLDGLIKLSGPIGAGKTSLAEAILYGLYGTIKGQNNTSLVAWNTQECEVEMNIISKNSSEEDKSEANNLIAVFDDLKSRMKFVFIGYYIGVSVFGGLDIWLCKVYRGKLKEFDRAYMEYDKFYNYFIIGEMIYYDSPKLVLWLIQSLLLLRRDNIHHRYIIISINLLFNFHIVFLLLYNLLQILLLFVFNEF